MKTTISSVEAALGLPKGVKIRSFFERWIIRKRDLRKVVAKEAYGLTHEFILNKLWDEFTGEGTQTFDLTRGSNPRRFLLQLDAEMREFAKKVEAENDTPGS